MIGKPKYEYRSLNLCSAKLVETESPSHDKSAVDKVGQIVAEECRQLGAEVETVTQSEVGDHILARWGSGPNGILLAPSHGHRFSDRDHWRRCPFVRRRQDLRSRCPRHERWDRCHLSAIRQLREENRMPARPVTALFTSDEEIGSDSSRALIEDLARESALVLVLESGLVDGALKVCRKGVGEYHVKVTGRASHAGVAHEEGRNAIQEMAHQVLAIQSMTDYSKGTTLNVGTLKGGTASNVVPEECEALVDYRVLVPEEADRVDAAMKSLKPITPGTSIKVTGGLNRPPMPEDDTMKKTFEKARQIAAGIGMSLTAGGYRRRLGCELRRAAGHSRP